MVYKHWLIKMISSWSFGDFNLFMDSTTESFSNRLTNLSFLKSEVIVKVTVTFYVTASYFSYRVIKKFELNTFLIKTNCNRNWLLFFFNNAYMSLYACVFRLHSQAAFGDFIWDSPRTSNANHLPWEHYFVARETCLKPPTFERSYESWMVYLA